MSASPLHRSAPARRGAVTGPVLVTLLLLAGGTAAALWWQNRSASAAEVIDPDRIVTVEAKDVIDSVTATGRVEPLARVAVMSRASGIIEQLLVEEGDVVAVGDVLAELDREQLEAQLGQDEADLQAARARVEAARARVTETRTRVDDPEPEFLRREVERLRALRANGTVSPRELDTAERELANAEFRVELVQASLPVQAAAVAEAEAGLAAAEADLERSATALREATIKSPIDGVVLTRDKEIGDGVSSILTAGGNATQLMTLGDLSSMHIEARVDEVDLGRIQTEMPVLVTVDAHRNAELVGQVQRIAPAGSIDDNGIVTFEVVISVDDPGRILRPDMTADAKLVIARRDQVPVLAQIAFRPEGEGRWSVDRVIGTGEAARVERVAVELGLSDGLLTEVVSGLEIGDRVLLPIARR